MADIVHRLSSLIKGRKRKVLDITVRLLCIFCCMPINLQSESMLKLVILVFTLIPNSSRFVGYICILTFK